MNAFRSRLINRQFIPKRTVLKSLALSTISTTGAITLCEGKDNNGNNNNNNNIVDIILTTVKDIANSNFDVDAIGQNIGSKAQEAIDSGVPTQISYGFLCGYSSGYALKKVGKMASVAFGLGFVGLQSLAYAGYIQLDHKALKEDMEKVFDLNQDGKVDNDDVQLVYNKIMEILQFNMTGGSGFAAGFLGGFRSG